MFDSEIQNRLLSLIEQVTQSATAGRSQAGEIAQPVKAVYETQIQAISENTQALLQNTIEKAGGLAGAAQTAGGVLSSIAKSVFGLAPLVSGISKLFGGGEQAAPPPLVEYNWPEPVNIEAGLTPAGTINVMDYGQGDLPRLMAAAQAMAAGEGRRWETEPLVWDDRGTASAAVTPGDGPEGGAAAGRIGGPQVTVQVQALDTRSFLDHSDEIARAVREAILSSHTLNDAMQEL